MTTYAYNLYGNLLERRAKQEGEEAWLSERYEYTPEGLLSAAISGGMRYRYQYDAMGRLAQKSASGRRLVSLSYDLNGNLTEQTDVTGKTTEYRYDVNDRNTEVWDAGSLTAAYAYYGDGTVKSLRCGSLYTEYVCPSGVERIGNAAEGRTATRDEYKKLSEHLRKQMRDGNGLTTAEAEAARKIGLDVSGAKIKSTGLPDWLRKRFEAGNNFNKENRPRYPYNEVEVYGKKKYVVDSYVPGSEIISRKYTQLADVKVSTGIGYLNELKTKYPSGAIITDSPFNPKILRGKTLTGNLVLEIPTQNKPIPQRIIDVANHNGIIIRDVTGKEYN